MKLQWAKDKELPFEAAGPFAIKWYSGTRFHLLFAGTFMSDYKTMKAAKSAAQKLADRIVENMEKKS
jgi:hypothetical protein